MFRHIRISRFKSLKEVEFEARRVNVLIGEPNTGKSNVLEALAVFCDALYNPPERLRDSLRFVTMADLFYDRDLSEGVRVIADKREWTLAFKDGAFQAQFALVEQQSNGEKAGIGKKLRGAFLLDHQGAASGGVGPPFSQLQPTVRYYRYRALASFPRAEYSVLQPPDGANLAALLTTHKSLRRLVGDLFRARGFRLMTNPEKNELFLAKEVDDQLYQFSYLTASETLRRIAFFMAVLETNQGAILLLDEPEANTFPFYTTYLAERIALDETNQFFLTTHNPYVLGALVAKTPARDLAVFVTTMDAYQTRLTPVTDQGLTRILESGPDAFLNLERLIAA